MGGVTRQRRRSLLPRRTAREAAVFAAAVALFADAVFYFSLADSQLDGSLIRSWSALKVLVIAAGVGWLAWETQTAALGLIAGIFLLIGLEDSIGVTAPLGVWLIEEGGLRRGPRGAYADLLRRGAVVAVLLGPTLYLGARARRRFRPAVWILIGFLGAIFLAAVLGDLFADTAGTNLDELLEEPLLSMCAGFVVGLIAAYWPERRLRGPTTG